MRHTVGTEVVTRHVSTAAVGDDDWQSLQKQTSVGVNVRPEGWLGGRPKLTARSDATRKMLISVLFFFLHGRKTVCHHLHLQSYPHPESGLTTYAAAAMTDYTACPDGLNQRASALAVRATSHCHPSQTNQ